jgi:hypothetical protein
MVINSDKLFSRIIALVILTALLALSLVLEG